MAKMTDDELRQLAIRGRDSSVDFTTAKQARDRKEAMQFYRGDNLDVYGDSGDGYSTIVSRDTMEAVESMLPSLCKPFVSGDQVVRYEPRGVEDEEPAKQATEYVNYLFSNHNQSFRVIYDSIKDGLLFRLGVGKVVYEKQDDGEVEEYAGLDEMQYQSIDPATIVGPVYQDEDGTYRCKVKGEAKGKFKVYVIAPDEFLHEERLASLDEATFLGHKKIETVGNLIAMGLPENACKGLVAMETDSDERTDRFQDEGIRWRDNRDSDDLARKVDITEAYVLCDYEGSGVLGWRRVWLGGIDGVMVHHEEIDDHPFVAWTPIPLPHKLIGLSIHDLTRDVQMQKTALTREQLNNLYLVNRPQREVLQGKVNIEDLLNPSIGGIIRVQEMGAVRDLATPFVADASFQMVEYLDNVREARTGVTRYNQGMDSNSLNKTATGVTLISNASQQRQELIARHYAESFLTEVFRKLLKLVCTHQDKAEVVRLRGQWVEMDPTQWKNEYDMSVAVGLGTGNRDQMIGQLTNLLQLDEKIVQLQGGLQGPILTEENVYEKLKRMVEAMGLKGVERYYTDPSAEDQQPQQGPQGPAPEQQAMEAQHAHEQQQAAMQAQSEQAKFEAQAQVDLQKASIDSQTKIEVARIQAEAAHDDGELKAMVQLMLARMEASAAAQTVVDADKAMEPAAERGNPTEMLATIVKALNPARKKTMVIQAPSGAVYNGSVLDEPEAMDNPQEEQLDGG